MRHTHVQGTWCHDVDSELPTAEERNEKVATSGALTLCLRA